MQKGEMGHGRCQDNMDSSCLDVPSLTNELSLQQLMKGWDLPQEENGDGRCCNGKQIRAVAIQSAEVLLCAVSGGLKVINVWALLWKNGGCFVAIGASGVSRSDERMVVVD